MADQIELARFTEETLPAAVPGSLVRGLRACVERSAFAAALSYVGFVVVLFVLLAAVLLAPVLAIALALACVAHDARSRRALGAG